MKKLLLRFICIVCLVFTSFISQAQKMKYPTKKINGVEYYVYTIKASEGLYSISKKFEVDKEDITKINPEVKDGLYFGQILLIPINKKATLGNKEKKNTPKYIEHTVEKKQTLFAISRKYNVTEEEITKLNPEIKNGLRIGTVIKIPIDNKKKEKEEKAIAKKEEKQTKENLKFKTHTVEPKETLYSISKKYDVEINQIIESNPGVDKQLSIGQVLKIPTIKAEMKISPAEEKTLKTQDSSIKTEAVTKHEESIKKDSKVLRIAYLLPFMLDNPKSEISPDRFMNFYAGSLLAFKEAKEKGISLQIYTFDTGKTENKLKEVLTNNDLKSMDIIIGPAYSNQVGIMGDFAKSNKVKTLIPFSSKVAEIDYNPYLFQFNPGTEYEIKFAGELLSAKFKKMNVIFIDIDDISYFDDGKVFVQNLKKELKDNKKDLMIIRNKRSSR